VTATAYLYPWDVVGDPFAAGRLAGLGVQRVAVAAAYHSVRAITPQHPHRRVVEARHAALYLPVRPRAWRGAAIRPRSGAAWTGVSDAFGVARDAVRAAGPAVDAWVVLTHASVLGTRHEHRAVRNAFGEVYRHALCPADAEVRDYCRRLVTEIAVRGVPDGLIVEACGPMGLGHRSAHDKTGGAGLTAVDEQLLSICCCPACGIRMAGAGLDPVRTAERLRAAVGAGHRDLADALGDDATALLAVRTGAVEELRDTVIDAARSAGVRRLVFHASADPWATGPTAAVTGAGDRIDLYLAGTWGDTADGVALLGALRDAVGAGPRLGAYVPILPPYPADADAFAARWQALRDGGADELHLYHAGLASPQRLEAARTALRALTAASPKEHR
jgi:hypothetical protein